MSARSVPMREDFRCEMCRQKSVFHCEHDTPYRDQYLGTYNDTYIGQTLNTSRRSKSEDSSMKTKNNRTTTGQTSKTDNRSMNAKNNKTTTGQTSKTDIRSMNAKNNKTTTGQTSNIDSRRTMNGKAGAQYQYGNQTNQTSGSTLAKAQPQNTKSKSCVIL